jgi:hypothetical protein
VTTATIPPRAVPRARPPAWARLLRIEFRRNITRWLLPLIAVAFWFDTYRTGTSYPPLWGLRTEDLLLHHVLPDLVPFVAGAAAWTGARERRRYTADLVTVTAWPEWGRRVVALGGTLGWAMAAYLGCVAVVLVSTATHATWGGPPLWPVVTGAAEVTAACAAGFACGWFLPGRLAAPLTLVGVFLVQLAGFHIADGSTSTIGLLSPTTHLPPIDLGVFYPYLPDVSIVQTMFLAGLAAVAVGALGLPAGSGGRRLRTAAVVLTVTGIVSAGTAVGLVSTARQGGQGMIIPALHDAASDRPIPYTPVCAPAGGIPVCVQPAFSAYLSDSTAALAPLLAQVAGAPGAPARLSQEATSCSSGVLGCDFGPDVATLSGTTVLRFTIVQTPGFFSEDVPGYDQQLISPVAAVLVGGQVTKNGSIVADPAQQVVMTALLRDAGMTVITPARANAGDPGITAPAPGSPAFAAYQRIAALPAAVRHAWLAAHLTALRAGHLTVAGLVKELP